MTRVIVVTGHVGAEWDEVAAVTLPSLRAWCGRHGYTLWNVGERLQGFADGRPPSWGKVMALWDACGDFDVAVWVDTDVVVAAAAPAIHEEYGVMDADTWQALATHHTAEGSIPNCGVWLVKAPMRPVLKMLWDDDRDHRWWEQAAVLRLMGFDVDTLPVERVAHANLWYRTATLDPRWNDIAGSDDAYMRHAAGEPSMVARLVRLKEWAS